MNLKTLHLVLLHLALGLPWAKFEGVRETAPRSLTELPAMVQAGGGETRDGASCSHQPPSTCTLTCVGS